MARVGDCYNVADFERAAKNCLPSPLYHYLDGGADDEITRRANTTAFDRYAFVPNYLTDVGTIDMSRTVLGCKMQWPLILAPTGMSRMFHPSGEIAVAAEAAKSGVAYALSTMATTSMEDIAKSSTAPKIFQLYLLNDLALNFDVIDRAKAAGYDALCLTVDTVVPGNREWDMRTGLTVPPRLTARSFMSFVAKPAWCAGYVLGGRWTLPNLAIGMDGDLSTLAALFNTKMERNITWALVEKIAGHWNGPLAIKGLQSVADARHAAMSGASAVIISNHGGRQLDSVPATIDIIADIADAVGDRIDVILDGGVRRGSHIVKAIAMGARACMTGRPYLYALSAYGQPGVARVLELLRKETERTLALLGCRRLDDVSRDHLRLASAIPEFLKAAPVAGASPRLWSAG